MTDFSLSATSWTEIVTPGGADDMEIRPKAGSLMVSLNIPAEKGAATLTVPPVRIQGGAWARREVMAGIAVYAKAIDGSAIVSVAPAAN